MYRNDTKIERHVVRRNITFTFFHRHSKSLSQKRGERSIVTRNRLTTRMHAYAHPCHRQLLHYISTTSRISTRYDTLPSTFAKTSFKNPNTWDNTSTFKTGISQFRGLHRSLSGAAACGKCTEYRGRYQESIHFILGLTDTSDQRPLE